MHAPFQATLPEGEGDFSRCCAAVARPKLAVRVLIRIVSWMALVFRPSRVIRANSMGYWIGVYALVIFVVCLPFLVLYLIASMLWLGVTVTQFLIRRVKNDWAASTDLFSREHWGMIRRMSRHAGQALRMML